MRTSLNQAMQRAFFGAIEAGAELRGRPAFNAPFSDAWDAIRSSRRKSYLTGIGRPYADTLDRLCADYPDAAQVRRSMAWVYLDPDTSELTCEARLFEECGVRRSSCSIDELLESFHATNKSQLGSGLDEVMRSVLALRIASHINKGEAIARAGQDLAKKLLLLTGCPHRRAASREIWQLASPFLKPTKKALLRFEPGTWEFVAGHALDATSAFRLMAFAIPGRGDLPASVPETLLRDIVIAVTTKDQDLAEFIFSRFNAMAPIRALSPQDETRVRLPDADKLSIWIRR